MERITSNAARQSLTEEGFRFVAPPIQPEAEWYCAECWWMSRAAQWESQYQWTTQPSALEQARLQQQDEVAQYILRERRLRQMLADRDARLKQLERRSRRHAQMFNMLEILGKRLKRLERHLGVLNIQPRMISPLVIDVDLDGLPSPKSVADQAN